MTQDLARLSDRLVVMTAEHRDIIIDQWPELAEKTGVDEPDEDICDPIGGTPEQYQACASQISDFLKRLLVRVRSNR